MSLKAFHIFFIAVSILLAFGVGIWGVYVHVQQPNVSFLMIGIGSFIVSIALIVYGVKVIQNLREI